jgi:hypothetical protein
MEEFKFPQGGVWHASTAPFLCTGPRREKPRKLDIFNLGLCES